MTSLRRRIFVGSVLWAAGLIVVASAIFSMTVDANPRARFMVIAHVHGVLQAPVVLSAAVMCLIAGALYVRRGLQRIDDLQVGLEELREGQGQRLSGAYPAEVQPLVDTLNALLAHRDEAVRRAVEKAGNLAHGLKTPLSVLAKEAEAAAAAGHVELAAALRHEIERMRRQIDYHLAHARATASAGTSPPRCAVHASVDGLVRAVQRIHADRGIAIDVDCPASLHVRVAREDLDEMLGNLLDNACKWASSRVAVSAVQSDDRVVIAVDDDGPGIAESLRVAVLARGVRADERRPGTGLGLAIVRDLAELYGGSIALEQSPRGGCRAELHLP